MDQPSTHPAVAALRAAREALAAVDPYSLGLGDLGDQIGAVHAEIDALTGTAARWTSAFADQDGPADAGAGSLAVWLRRQLRVTGKDARRRVRTGRLLATLPATAKALEAGDVTVEHVAVLARAARDLGLPVIAEAEPILLPVAQTGDPDDLATTIQRLRDTLDPDAADEAYVRALEARDVTVTPVGDLYQLRGVLDPITGQTVKNALYALAAPTSKDDPRTAGQRRVDALRQVCDERLRNGVPTDHGIRPQLIVTVTQPRLTHTAPGLAHRAVADKGTTGPGRSDADPCGPGSCSRGSCGPGSCVHEPAVLHGYGTIGDQLLAQLACDADQTRVDLDHTGHVLDVGRTHRLATAKQRIAILTRQGGVCAAPGCTNTHLEIHHRHWWSRGGHTNLNDLAGYCSRCHHLIHAGLLVVTPDGNGGWTHEDRRGNHLTDRRTQIERTNRDHRHHLAHQIYDHDPDNDPGPGDTPDVDARRLQHELQRQRRQRHRRRRGDPYRPWPPRHHNRPDSPDDG
jgi:hypothetical protein